MIFREEHMELILRGMKTVTRRRHKYPRKAGKVYRTKKDWYHYRDVWILITRVYRQRLVDVTEDDAQKEGGYTLEEFKKLWERINGGWDPDEVVWVYEFKVVDKLKSPEKLS
jgi:hypothetical protein